MASEKDTSNTNWVSFKMVPFTSGIIVFVWAFFWPESYGHWLGSIVRAFRQTSGF